jgi:hypothetical protein
MSNSSSAKMSAIDASLARLGELTVCRPAIGRDHPDGPHIQLLSAIMYLEL